MTMHFSLSTGGGLRWFAVCAVLLANSATTFALPPEEPLPIPKYSFDPVSPIVIDGQVAAGDILVLLDLEPTAVLDAANLGLVSTLDDLDGMSAANAGIMPEDVFVLLFSVDRDSIGLSTGEPNLIVQGVRYTVEDQAMRGQGAGDQFMAVSSFSRVGGKLRSSRTGTNTQTINNYDEGGVDFGALPAVSAQANATGLPQDNVDAFANVSSTRGLRQPTNLYFTLNADSPSLGMLPGGNMPSGAHVFYNPEPAQGTQTELYAHFADLGLGQVDDVDALVVFDVDANGIFDGVDRVLFSLTPGSPSLGQVGGSPADVFVALPGLGFSPFANAFDLGLNADFDNTDALDIFVCPDDPLLCALRHGMRILRGDTNCDGRVDYFDIAGLLEALSGEAYYQSAYPDCFWLNADCNCDGHVDYFDVNPFLDCLGGTCSCPLLN